MTEPLVPSEVDLRDFPFMPLDVVRLRDSDLAALETPEACWAAVLLWCASWHQIPAASLPDDDRILAQLADYGRAVSQWQKVRDGALRGWIKCSDGRLYHPVVAEKANEAWHKRTTAKAKGQAGAKARWSKGHSESNATAIPQAQPTPMPGDGNRQGEGEGERERKKDAAGAAKIDLEKQLFERGKVVLGQNAGGLIAKLLKVKGLELARAAIETAATKQSPREYLGRVLAGPGVATSDQTDDETLRSVVI